MQDYRRLRGISAAWKDLAGTAVEVLLGHEENKGNDNVAHKQTVSALRPAAKGVTLHSISQGLRRHSSHNPASQPVNPSDYIDCDEGSSRGNSAQKHQSRVDTAPTI